jgi:hypothetical protein
MEAGVMLVSVAAFVMLGFTLVGGPLLLVDWSRERRRTVIERQIALTDALDGVLGPIVAPVVSKPLFRPWEIQIAVPFLRSAELARMVSVVDDVFFRVEGGRGLSYRIVLSMKRDAVREVRRRREHRSPKRWAGNAVGAA